MVWKVLAYSLLPTATIKNNITPLIKIKNWSLKISRGFITRFAAGVALCTILFCTVEYQLAATTFSTKQCNLLLRPILKATLPKLGIARTTGHKCPHGSLKHQGCNILHIYSEMGFSHLNLLFQHGRQSSQVGAALNCCLEGLQIECGAVENIGIEIWRLQTSYFWFDIKTHVAFSLHLWILLRNYAWRPKITPGKWQINNDGDTFKNVLQPQQTASNQQLPT